MTPLFCECGLLIGMESPKEGLAMLHGEQPTVLRTSVKCPGRDKHVPLKERRYTRCFDLIECRTVQFPETGGVYTDEHYIGPRSLLPFVLHYESWRTNNVRRAIKVDGKWAWLDRTSSRFGHVKIDIGPAHPSVPQHPVPSRAAAASPPPILEAAE